MTEWDHGHGGADHHEAGGEPDWADHHEAGGEPDWASAGPAPDAQLAEPSGLDDLVGSPGGHGPAADPDHPGPAAEPAGLPAEHPADWSAWDAADVGSGSADWDAPHPFHDDFSDVEPDPGDGTDPAGWTAGAGSDPFPPALDLDVQPADGGPWVDPALLGGPDRWTAGAPGPDLAGPADPPAALLPDLAAADGDPDAGWETLRDSADPAVRALAVHWHPGPE
jgi:hypothetical protein